MSALQETVIGVIGAMDEEIELLVQAVQHSQSIDIMGLHYYTGMLHGKQIVICKSGVGKVNATITTQLLIERFQVNCVLFTGVAGALHPELHIGDVVISTACIHHDMDVTALGFALGTIPFQETSQFMADEQLVKLAERVCKQLIPGRYRKGVILSGDQFISSQEKASQLFEIFPSSVCIEMEGAAVAQTCFIYHIPYVIIRTISDKADRTAHINFTTFVVEAAHRSHQIINHMVQEIRSPVNNTSCSSYL